MTAQLLRPISCKIMGVLNITPDSFSDGGRYLDAGSAWDHIHSLVADGADIIDIGAESSRPGAAPVSSKEEWTRLEPILLRIAKENLRAQISIDSRKPELMLRAADLGVHYINDIEGGRDRSTLELLAKKSAVSYICMHMHESPETMQQTPLRGLDGLNLIDDFFAEKTAILSECGFDQGRIFLDPGFGFGKSDDLNAKIIAAIGAWKGRGCQIAVGVSRKSFFNRMLDLPDPESRDAPSKMCEFGLALMGTDIIRTHNVKLLKKLLSLL